MNEDSHANDPLERELRALRPRELADGFVDSLGQLLEPPAPRENRRSPQRFGVFKVLAPLAAVAALILVTFWLARNRPLRERPALSTQEIAKPNVQPREGQAIERPGPTLIAYSQVVANQQGNLEELLDYHARTLLPNVPDPESAEQWP